SGQKPAQAQPDQVPCWLRSNRASRKERSHGPGKSAQQCDGKIEQDAFRVMVSQSSGVSLDLLLKKINIPKLFAANQRNWNKPDRANAKYDQSPYERAHFENVFDAPGGHKIGQNRNACDDQRDEAFRQNADTSASVHGIKKGLSCGFLFVQ